MKQWLLLFVACLLIALPAAADVDHYVSFHTPQLTEWSADLDGNNTNEIYTKIQMDGAPLMANPGEPLMPHRPVTLLLPQNQVIESVNVSFNQWNPISGSWIVAPGQHSYPLSRPQDKKLTAPASEIYSSKAPFPAVTHSAPRVFWCKGYQLVTFNLFPVRYIPADGQLLKADNAQIHITTIAADTSSDRVRCRGLASDAQWVAGKVDNPRLVNSYVVEPAPANSLLSRDVYQYVLISNDTLIGASGPNNFQDLLAFKATRGISSIIKPVDEIYSEYTGTDNQEKIRNFCIDAYNNWQTEYILIGGDHEIVPTRGCYATAEGHEDNTIPTDMYFGCLDGNWNDNGNSSYGEVDDGPGGTEPDVYAELFIGRCAADDATEVRNFVGKIITYETDDYQADWADNALLLGEYLWPQTYGGDYMDELWYGSDLWGYTTPGYPANWTVDNLYERESSWGSGDLTPLMNSNDFHWINHLGHANETSVMHMSTSTVDSLTNSRPFIVYSQGCYAGAFDTTDCIAEHFSWSEHGAFAVFMNGRYGWGEIGCTDGPGQYFHRQFHDAIFTEDIRELGRMNADSKEDNVWCMNYKANRWTCYEVNLLGCPQTPLFGRATTRGQFNLDREAYTNDNDTVTATVIDVDLNLDPGTPETVDVTMETNNGDLEQLTLTETGMNTCIFQGTINTSANMVELGNGTLEVSEGNLITGSYVDASDGFGGTNITITDTAVVDMTLPVISNVEVAFLDDTSATITWTTDEPCNSQVFYQAPVREEITIDELVTDHVVTLTNLAQCLDYQFSVSSSDAAGNTETDDNGGSYYSFTTMVRIYALQENMDSDPGWTITGGDWEFGQPTGQPSGPGADPTAGFDGANVYGTNLNGAYAGGSTPYHLVTPPIDCSAAMGVRFSFYQWLAIDEHDSDEAYISVSNDGTTWHQIYENPASNLYDYTWTRYEYDISEYADLQPTVYIRWTLGPAGSGSVGGWNVDNVEVSYAAPCNVPILIHDSHVIDDSTGNNDGLLNPLESIFMPVTLRNVGLEATNVSATLTSDHTGVFVTNPTVQFPNVPQGGYGTSLTDFGFDVTENVVDGDPVAFTVEWTSDETTATTTFMEEIVAPNLVFDGFGVMDMDGDGDGIFDPGETVQLTVTLENAGRLAANNVLADIESNYPEYITIQQGCASYPDMEPGASGTSTDPYYTITADQTTPDHLIVTFNLDIQADGHHKSERFDVEITTSTFTRRHVWDMEDDPQWTCEGQWQFGVPQGNEGDPGSGYTGDNVYGYNLAGPYGNDMDPTSLTTDAINCANFSDVEVRFMRWLGVESSSYDHASFEVSNDGSTWATLYSHDGSSFTDPDWQSMSYDISSVADGQATVYMRWVMGETDSSVTYCGWNLDDVELWASSDSPQPVLTHVSHVIDDSAGNNDGMINPMESIAMDVTAENVGIAGTGITAFLSTDNPNVTVTQDASTFPDLPAGGQAATETSFEFDVSGAAANGEEIEFTVTYFSDSGNGSFTFTETIAGPALTVGGYTISDDGDHDGVLDPGENAVLEITLNNAGPMTVTGVSGIISSDSPAYFFIDDGESDFEDVTGLGSGSTVSPHFAINAAGFTPDPTIVTVTLDVTANEATAQLSFEIEITESNFMRRYNWNMDEDPGWTAEGQWEWGVPLGNEGDPTSGYTGDNVYGYNLAGDYTNSMSETYLTTNSFDCSNLDNIELRFMRWLGVESASYDHAAVEVTGDGSTWTTVWEHTGSSFTDTDWTAQAFDITSVAAGQAEVAVRWVMGSSDSSVTYCGWNIDDVEIWADSTGNPCVHHGDCNFDGEVTSGDAQMAFMIALGMITPSFEEECAADCNGDEEVTAGDAQQVFMTALGMTSCVDPMPAQLNVIGRVDSHQKLPVTLKAVSMDQGKIEIAVWLNSDHRDLDAFTLEFQLDSRFHLVDCLTGDLELNWVDFGCSELDGYRVRLGAYNDGMTDPVAYNGTSGILATLILEGPVNAILAEGTVPVQIIGCADDLR